MRHHLKFSISCQPLTWLICASLMFSLPAVSAPVILATSPLANSGNSAVAPNLMFMLDDSGSMDWDFMPDNAKNFAGKYGFNSSQCNGTYYNPISKYDPPVNADGTSKGNASFSAALVDGYVSTSTIVDLNSGFTGGSGSGASGNKGTPGSAFYYTYSGTQTTSALRDIFNTSSTFYLECNSSIGSAPGNTKFTKVRLASTPTTTIQITGAAAGGGATITVSGSSTTAVKNIFVNSTDLLNNTTTGSSNKSSTVAKNIRDGINANTSLSGYSATSNGSVVTITGPGSAGNFSPAVTNASGTMSYTYTPFPSVSSTAVTGITVNGTQLLLSGSTASTNSPATLAGYVATAINATGYSATSSGNTVTITGPSNGSASNYTPIITSSGGMTFVTDAFPESTPAKLQNFANWYSYYSNRMLMMKTGVGRAFSTMNNSFRIGYMSMNNNNYTTAGGAASADFVNIAPFDATQKTAWYNKLYAANPGNSTPLREALSNVGRLYAHKFGSLTTYTSTITVGGSGSTSVDSITINGNELLVGPSTADPSKVQEAKFIVAQVKDTPTAGIFYTAKATTGSGSNGVITITTTSPVSGTPVVSNDGGGMTFTVTAFTASTVTASLNNVTPADPVQYSCQKNFVLLSTDGYWNGSTTYDLNGSPVGNQDTTAPRPMYDGGLLNQTSFQILRTQTLDTKVSSQIQEQRLQEQKQISQLQSQTSQLQSQTSQLQSQTSQLQTRSANLQKQTSQQQIRSARLQTQTSQLQQSVGTLQYQTTATVQMQCANTTNSCGTAPASGTPGKGTGCTICFNWTVVTSPATCAPGKNMQCQTVTTTGSWTTATAATTPCVASPTRNCQYTWGTPQPAASCSTPTYVAGDYTKATVYNCVATITSAYANASAACSATIVPVATGANTGNTTQCRYWDNTANQAWSSQVATGSTCTSALPDFTNLTARECPTVITSAFANVPTGGSCTPTTVPIATGANTGNTTQCRYWDNTANASWSSQVATGSTCTSALPDFTNLTARECPTVITSAFANVPTGGSCTPTTVPIATGANTGNTTQCRYWDNTANASWSSQVAAATCAPVAPSTGTTFTVLTARECPTVITSPFADAPTCSATTTPIGSGTNLGNTTQCQTIISSPYANTPACTSTTTPNGSGQTTQCQTAISLPYAAALACTATTTPNGSGQTTQCQTVVTSAWANAACGAADVTTIPDAGGNTTQCRTLDSGFVGAASCSAHAVDSSGLTIVCPATNPVALGSTYDPNCANQTAAASNNYTSVTCSTTTPSAYVASCDCAPTATNNSTCAVNVSVTTPLTGVIPTVCTYISPSAGNQTGLSACTNQSPSTSNNYTTITCTGSAGSGTADTLADVAMYYYQNDLRTSTLGNCAGALGAVSSTVDSVCDNNVPTSGIDTNNAQHMTTYTLGLGARGRMAFSPTYETDTSGDFYSVWSPKPPTLGYTLAAPKATPPVCSWQTVAGTKCNWPTPSSGQPENIDDLWHAAVNGRGSYFNATDPDSLSTGLLQTLKKINQVTGAAAAAATSTLNPTSTDHSAFVASYTTIQWTGNLESRDIDIVTGVVSKTAAWCVENVADGTCVSPGTPVVDNAVHYCAAPATDTNLDGVIDASDCSALEVFDTATSTCRAQIQYTCNGTMAAKVAQNTRHIYTSSGSSLINFSATDTTFNTAYGAYFNATTLAGLSQWAALGTTNQATATANIVDYLRGNHNYEENRSTNTDAGRPWLFRYRDAVMGDALESQPTFVAAPTFNYGDASYAAFKSAKASRPGMVFIGTNDGMLHAFYAQDRVPPTAPAKCAVGAVSGNYCGGEEAWAYVPSMVIPNMWKLADRNYDTNHVNFVNGSPVISDFCPKAPAATCAASEWKTILVGGLNAGGRGYYALDITDTTNPLLLWEFSPAQDANLGYSFGKPVVTKKADGTWVVLVSSGYNNGTLDSNNVAYTSNAGDGNGYLYMLNANTGSLLPTDGGGKFPTVDSSGAVGSQASPSGFAKFNAFNDVASNNQAGYVYGGDLMGNVWRFDINAAASTGTNPNPLQFATLFSDTAGTLPQPITAAPTLGKLNNKDVTDKRVIFVGTGKYLEKSTLYHNDLADTQTQSLYAIMDNDAMTTFINPRSVTQATPAPNPPVAGKMVKQTITFVATQSSSRTIDAPKPVNFSRDRGWYVDFPESGERTNIDFKLVQGTLIVPTIVPTSTACSQGGHGWLNYLNYETGGPVVSTDPLHPNYVVSQYYHSPIVGTNVIYINGVPIVEVVTSEYPTPTIPPEKVPFRATPGGFSNQRETWRELIP